MGKILSRIFICSLFLILCLSNDYLYSQEWSNEQLSVWNSVESLYENWANRNLEGYMSLMHKDFTGWFSGEPTPINYESLEKWEKDNFNRIKVLVYDNQPLKIKVFKNLAIVQYYSSVKIKDEKENIITRNTQWTEVLTKEGDKWLFIGTHGGVFSND